MRGKGGLKEFAVIALESGGESRTTSSYRDKRWEIKMRNSCKQGQIMSLESCQLKTRSE